MNLVGEQRVRLCRDVERWPQPYNLTLGVQVSDANAAVSRANKELMTLTNGAFLQHAQTAAAAPPAGAPDTIASAASCSGVGPLVPEQTKAAAPRTPRPESPHLVALREELARLETAQKAAKAQRADCFRRIRTALHADPQLHAAMGSPEALEHIKAKRNHFRVLTDPSVEQRALIAKVRHAHQASVENADLCHEANTSIIALQKAARLQANDMDLCHEGRDAMNELLEWQGKLTTGELNMRRRLPADKMLVQMLCGRLPWHRLWFTSAGSALEFMTACSCRGCPSPVACL
jgi:hypothetical protein